LLFMSATASPDSFSQSLGISLQSVPSHNFEIIDGDNLVFIKSDVTIELKFTLPQIRGS